MPWYVPALLTALASAAEVACVKRFFSDRPALETLAVPLAFSLPLFLSVLLALPAPAVAPDFWPILAVTVPLNALGYYLTIRAVTVSPLSLTMPFQALSPVAVLFTGLVILNEVPSPAGVLGVVGVALGSYVLGLGGSGSGPLAPIRAVFREPGPPLMIGAALVFAFCAVLGKRLLLASSPLFAGMLFFVVHNVVVLSALLATRRTSPARLLARPGAGALVGLVLFLHIFLHFTALSQTAAAYMIAVKRLSALFSVAAGGLFFKEEHMAARLAGAALMTAGALVVVLLG